MASTSRFRVFLDVTIGAEPAGRLTIELFADKTPKTCENFRQLCTNSDPDLSFAMSPFHRIIDEFMIQGGDITAGNGTGGKSIYNDGGEFEDENLDWREMDTAGLVCMANRGKDTNSSQFFITLDECPHLNGKHTIFGHLVAGQDVLQKMAKVKVDDEDKPRDPVLIARCGELERKKKTVSTKKVSPERVALRGRRPSQLSESPSPPHSKERDRSPRMADKRKRRQSDNHIDENLRGRPRARSDDDDNAVISEDHSPTPDTKHQRERSPSPHRMTDGTKDGEDDEGYRRRRRSLPNQYHNESRDRRRDSEKRSNRNDSGRRDDRRGAPRDWDDPRTHERRDDRSDDRRNKPYGRRHQDSYRPRQDTRQDHGRLGGDGRLGAGGGGDDGGDGAIKFKGRGSMKFREPDRRW